MIETIKLWQIYWKAVELLFEFFYKQLVEKSEEMDQLKTEV